MNAPFFSVSSPFCPALVAAMFCVGSAFALPPIEVKSKTTDAAWKILPVRTVGEIPGFRPSDSPPQLDIYGGDPSGEKAKGTGFFRVEKLADRWWFIDPMGNRFLSMAMNSVNIARSPSTVAAFNEKFGSDRAWAIQTLDLLRAAGFNTIGNWSSVEALRLAPKPMPYCASGSFLASFAREKDIAKMGSGHVYFSNDSMPVFDPDFPAFCDRHAKALARNPRDPYLLGYFCDNELLVPDLEKYLGIDPADASMNANYRAARTWFDRRKGKGAPLSAITSEDREAWMEVVYDRYFQLTTAAIRKYDPNHLIIGARFYKSEKKVPAVFRAAGRYCDVISVNLYGSWQPKREDVERWTEWSGRPVIITEWYAKGQDSGMGNVSGAGFTVKTQRDRGLFYQTFTLALLETNNCIGWHWFKYQDNDPLQKNSDPSNRDSNKGIVKANYEPYTPLLKEMTELNRNAYRVLSQTGTAK